MLGLGVALGFNNSALFDFGICNVGLSKADDLRFAYLDLRTAAVLPNILDAHVAGLDGNEGLETVLRDT